MAKIWVRLVLDSSGKVSERESEWVEYEGPVAECKGGGGSTTVQQADPWIGQQPHLRRVFSEAERLYLNQGLWPQYYPGSQVAGFSNETQAALNMATQRAVQGSPVLAQAQQAVNATLGGQYLYGSNPYLQQAIGSATRAISENYRDAVLPGVEARFAKSGRYGSGAYERARVQAEDQLARNLGEVATNMAYQNYADERQRQIQAAALAPNLAISDYADIEKLAAVGATRDANAQARLDDAVARYNYQQNLPAQMLADYMAMIQGTYGGTTRTTQSAVQVNPLAQGVSGMLAGMQLGSLFPGPGNIVGAGVGGLLGLFS